MKLTPQNKLEALALRFYQGHVWEPKPGDYYTSSRADLEVYRVVDVTDDEVITEYAEGGMGVSKWPRSEFTTEGFGLMRVWVPEALVT